MKKLCIAEIRCFICENSWRAWKLTGPGWRCAAAIDNQWKDQSVKKLKKCLVRSVGAKGSTSPLVWWWTDFRHHGSARVAFDLCVVSDAFDLENHRNDKYIATVHSAFSFPWSNWQTLQRWRLLCESIWLHWFISWRAESVRAILWAIFPERRYSTPGGDVHPITVYYLLCPLQRLKPSTISLLLQVFGTLSFSSRYCVNRDKDSELYKMKTGVLVVYLIHRFAAWKFDSLTVSSRHILRVGLNGTTPFRGLYATTLKVLAVFVKVYL